MDAWCHSFCPGASVHCHAECNCYHPTTTPTTKAPTSHPTFLWHASVRVMEHTHPVARTGGAAPTPVPRDEETLPQSEVCQTAIRTRCRQTAADKAAKSDHVLLLGFQNTCYKCARDLMRNLPALQDACGWTDGGTNKALRAYCKYKGAA